MTIAEMMEQSSKLTLMGMGVVFTFIIILIFCLGVVQRLIRTLKLDGEEQQLAPVASVSTAPAVGGSQGNDNAVIAAIAAAVRTKLS